MFKQVSDMNFLRPVDIGDLLRFRAKVLRAATSGSGRPCVDVEVEALVTRPEAVTSDVSNTFMFTFYLGSKSGVEGGDEDKGKRPLKPEVGGAVGGAVGAAAEGVVEGAVEGAVEGTVAGAVAGAVKGVAEGAFEGAFEGAVETATEKAPKSPRRRVLPGSREEAAHVWERCERPRLEAEPHD